MGPAIGSLVYSAIGYEATMYYYSILAFSCVIMSIKVMPDSLDRNTHEKDELARSGRQL